MHLLTNKSLHTPQKYIEGQVTKILDNRHLHNILEIGTHALFRLIIKHILFGC